MILMHKILLEQMSNSLLEVVVGGPLQGKRQTFSTVSIVCPQAHLEPHRLHIPYIGCKLALVMNDIEILLSRR